MRHRCSIPWLLAALLCALAAACQPQQAGDAAATAGAGAARPADAVRLLTRHLRADDLEAFARDAVPPTLYRQLETAWREGRTRWPLDELPLGERVPDMLAALAKPGSEARLRRTFDRQFAGAARELKSTAATLGLFGAQYVANEGDFSADERDHYSQLIAAASLWAQSAPLSDPKRGHAAIDRLAAAARKTGLAGGADFARLGMSASLRRLSPMAAATRQVLASYGLHLDVDLGALDASLQEQTGDTARVRMRYALGGHPIDTVVSVERHDGRWYVSDFLRHAEAAVKAKPPPAPAAPSRPATPAKPAATRPASA